MRNAGFTLIEMMVVIVLLGIVAAVVAVNVGEKPGGEGVNADLWSHPPQ